MRATKSLFLSLFLAAIPAASWSAEKDPALREEGAARQEAKRGKLGDPSTEFEQNKLARCALHRSAEDKDLCERRMRGEGTTTGSVEGGGIYRELRTIVPAEEGTASAGGSGEGKAPANGPTEAK